MFMDAVYIFYIYQFRFWTTGLPVIFVLFWVMASMKMDMQINFSNKSGIQTAVENAVAAGWRWWDCEWIRDTIIKNRQRIVTFFKTLKGISAEEYSVYTIINATHEFIDSLINPLVNDGNRTAFAESLKRMLKIYFHDNELSAKCKEIQVVGRSIGQTFAENSTRAQQWWWHITWYNQPQQQLKQLFLEHRRSRLRWCSQNEHADNAGLEDWGSRGKAIGAVCWWIFCHQEMELQEVVCRLDSIRDDKRRLTYFSEAIQP